MNVNETFVKAHWNQTILLGTIVTIVVFGQAILEEKLIVNKKTRGSVKGEITVASKNLNSQDKFKEILAYQSQLKQIINSYLQKRSLFDKPHKNWLYLITKTKYRLLSMNVPEEYKQLQLRLVITLDKERQAIEAADDTKIESTNQLWALLLEQFFWLNN